MDISLNTNQGVVLVDTGYYAFNRYFSTLKWYRFYKKAHVEVSELHENEEFLTAFKGHIHADLLKFSMFPYFDRPFCPRLPQKGKKVRNKVIMCLDCKRSDIWRMEIYDAYKSTRKHSTDLNMQVMGVLHDHIDQLISNGDIDVVKVYGDHLEADDIVYLCLKQLRSMCKPAYQNPVLVISNDNDFLQLTSLNAIVANMKGVHLIDRMPADNSRTSTFLKVLMGDISDNIKPVPCVSKKDAIMLAKMKETERQEWIVEHTVDTGAHSCIKAYKLNKKLILLSNIPKNLAQAFHEKFHFTVVVAPTPCSESI